MNPQRIVLYGIASEYAYEMAEVALRAGVEIVACIDNMPESGDFPGLEPVFRLENCGNDIRDVPAIVPLVTPGHRKTVTAQLREQGFSDNCVLVDPTAILASSVKCGSGFQVNAAVVIGANSRFGDHVLVNRSVSIGHDVAVDDYVSFGPGCVLCGSCRIGAGTFVGGGATIAPRVCVGNNAIIGAGAVVVREVPDNTVVAGNPAKIIREGVRGYNGVSV